MFNLDPTSLFFSIVFSFVAMGYYSYGKKNSLYFQLAGIGLFFVTFFISNVAWLIGSGILLIILPFILEHFE